MKTKHQVLQQNYPLSKEFVEEHIADCTTYKQLAERLNVSDSTAQRLVDRYGLKINRIELKLPEADDVIKLIQSKKYISVDEIAKELGVETAAVERVMRKNKIKVLPPHRVYDYNTFSFARWISGMLEKGDSPVQIGELIGISSAKARKLTEKLHAEYSDCRYFAFPKIPEDKLSPSEKEIKEFINKIAKKKFTLPKYDRYHYSDEYWAKEYLKTELCKKLNISKTTLDYLFLKYNLEDLLESTSLKILS